MTEHSDEMADQLADVIAFMRDQYWLVEDDAERKRMLAAITATNRRLPRLPTDRGGR